MRYFSLEGKRRSEEFRVKFDTVPICAIKLKQKPNLCYILVSTLSLIFAALFLGFRLSVYRCIRNDVSERY